MIAVGLSTGVYGYMYSQNNKAADYPDKQAMTDSLNRSIDWIFNNQERLLNDNNPILWWFLEESAVMTENQRLYDLVQVYKKTPLPRNSVWHAYFDRNMASTYSYVTGTLDAIPDYNKMFIYGITCENDLGDEAFIQRQLIDDFCDWSPFFSSCSTHQLMGVRFMQRNNCGDSTVTSALVATLVSDIEGQLRRDPRVGDVYIQRVLMLVDSGAKDRINPRWVHRIMENQMDDGSWANFDPLLKLSTDKYFGFSYKFIDIRTPEGSLHTTAQAIYLLSYLLSE